MNYNMSYRKAFEVLIEFINYTGCQPPSQDGLNNPVQSEAMWAT